GDTVEMNLGTGVGSSVFDVLRATEQVSGCPVPHDVVARRPGDPVTTFADPARAREVLGWSAEHDLDDIVRTAFAWAYVAMRALGEPDAFPAGDLGLRKAAPGIDLNVRAEAWRPWRAYAALHLWASLGDEP
ncbi:MAG: hypothetical protein R6X35_05125, partial [Candidatus Krumholzibacteriia bacterium]